MNPGIPAVKQWQDHTISALSAGWEYIRNELLYLAWAVMEVALLTPLSLALMEWARYWPPGTLMLWFLLVMLLPFNLGRLMSLLRVSPQRQQIVMVVGLLLTVILAWRTLLYTPQSLFDFGWIVEFYTNLGEGDSLSWQRNIVIFILVVFVWWRGIRLISREPHIDQAGLRLRVGGVILIPVVMWLSYGRLSWDITPFLLLFFVAGLTAVSLARAEQIEREQSGLAASLTPRWMGAVFATSLCTVLVAGILATIFSANAISLIFIGLAPVWSALQFGGMVVISIFSYLLQPLIILLGHVVEIVITTFGRIAGPGLNTLLQRLQSFTNQSPIPPPTATVEETATSTGEKSIILLLMLAAILAVSLALWRFYHYSQTAAYESGTVDTSARLDRQKQGLAQRLLDRLGVWRRWRTAASIRRIYRQMCQEADSEGFPRVQSETPYEYTTTLIQLWPQNGRDVWLITDAYVKVRYGEIPETPEELEQIRQAWQRLQEIEPQKSGEIASTETG